MHPMESKNPGITVISKDSISKDIEAAIKVPFNSNLTDTLKLDAVNESISEIGSLKMDKYLKSREDFGTLTDVADRIGADLTKTPGQKLLLKSEKAEAIYKEYGKEYDNLSRDIVSEMQMLKPQLFSYDTKLNPAEMSMLNIVAVKLQEGTLDVFDLAGSESPSEARIALEMAKNFPSLLEDDLDKTGLFATADNKHTLEIREKMLSLGEATQALKIAHENITAELGNYANKDLLKLIEGKRV